MKDIYEVLKQLSIPYQKHEHPAVFTVEEAAHYDRDIDAGKSKNLFLRNKKGNKHFLVVVEATRKVDLKKLGEVLNEKNIGFASPERLKQYLGLTPGSVSPFGLVNDTEHSVEVIIDNGLIDHETVGFHPNINTATLVITTEDFKKYLAWTENKVTFMDL